jgi:hypothetical protein
MSRVLPCERDNPPRPFNTEAGENLSGNFLWGDPALGIDDHAIGQDTRTLHDWLAGYLSRDSLYVRAVCPIDHVDLGDGAGVGL